MGRVRDHNEDAHYFDPETGTFLVCDGMGGHAAGEVASAIAIETLRRQWTDSAVASAAKAWEQARSAAARRALLNAIRAGALVANEAILADAAEHDKRRGMGTTFVGMFVTGTDAVISNAGDSRAYLVRDGFCVQVTEDHTLLARLRSVGVDVDLAGPGARYKSQLTTALGLGLDLNVSSMMIPLLEGDRFVLCSDGVSEYFSDREIGDLVSSAPSPARAAQLLVNGAVDRGGRDNATAVVLRVVDLERDTKSSTQLQQDEATVAACPLFEGLTQQKRWLTLRAAVEHDIPKGERLPAFLKGSAVGWVLLSGAVSHGNDSAGVSSLLYPGSFRMPPTVVPPDDMWVAAEDVRALAIRADDFRQVGADDTQLGLMLERTLLRLNGDSERRRTASVSTGVPGDFEE